MKTGLKYGLVAWLLSLLIMPFVAPLLFRGGNMQAIGSTWLPLSFFCIGLPAFLIGYFKERNQ
jgi:hypothetical protein